MDIQTQMQNLRLYGMHRSWQELIETKKHHELTLSEGLELLLQAEEEDKKNRRFERLRKNARFRYQVCIEELQFDASRGMNKELIMTLLQGITSGTGSLCSSQVQQDAGRVILPQP